jgi:hypothetical protein
MLPPYQSPRLSAVAVGQVTKMTVIVKGGLPPRMIEAPAPTALASDVPAALESGAARPDDATTR